MKYILILLLLTGAQPSYAQNLDATAKKQVVDSLCRSLVINYIYLDTAIRMGAFIEKRLKEGAYEKITNPREFAQTLGTDLRSIYNDAHLSIVYDPQMVRNIADTSRSNAAEKHRLNLIEYGEQNFGFKKLEILDGNIGYVSFDRFYAMNDEAREVVNTTFSFLKNVHALIIDLRGNGGGSPEMEKYIASFLLQPGTQLSGFYERRTGKLETSFTIQPSIPVSFADRPVYILVNRRSFSAAETFAYDLQSIHRATIIGERTGGGAHAVGPISITNGFAGLIPYARAVNPITGTNWEAVGIDPDIRIHPDSALDAAVLSFYDDELANTKDSVSQKKISWPRDMLQAKLHPFTADTSILKTYEGNFVNRIVSFENGSLFYTGTDGKRSRLVALSSDTFKMADVDYLKIVFTRNTSRAITGMNFIFSDGFVSTYSKK